MTVHIKTAQEIEKMRIAGRLASEVLDYITPFVEVGVTTEELDTLCHHYMVDVQNTIPAPLNYAPSGHSPYPKSICTSVNNQICHGVPGQKKLKNGDIVLFHDSMPETPGLVEQFIIDTKNKGMEFVGLDELLKFKHYDNPTFKYL